ncbi:MAG: hypothetical protein RMN25_03830 [Anaerolineae bacterium]|nr:hypothetical protein [Thermoflexales bacterium]MDW8406891.1 hypothetical protein [Anaerolineae bacterium]
MSLHAALKAWCAEPGDMLESTVEGYVIDIVRNDGALLIEIQTGHFSALRAKLTALTRVHHVRLIYPVPAEKWIVRLASDEQTEISRRRSPKRGQVLDIFRELPAIARLVAHPHLSIEVVLVRAEEVLCPAFGRRRAGRRPGWRRKGWRILDRRLIDVISRHVLQTPDDFRALLPAAWLSNVAGVVSDARLFTTRDLANTLSISLPLAQKMAYCLREMGVITPLGRRGRALAYSM